MHVLRKLTDRLSTIVLANNESSKQEKHRSAKTTSLSTLVSIEENFISKTITIDKDNSIVDTQDILQSNILMDEQ